MREQTLILGAMMNRARALYAAAQVREMDRRAIAGGIPGYTLMQRAAAAAWRALRERWGRAQQIVVLCGPGNNGGDGYELARLARADGCALQVWQFGGLPQQGDGARAAQAWLRDGGSAEPWPERGLSWGGEVVIVDAIFGTGLTRPPPAEVQQAIAAVAAARARGAGVLAIDIPSGVAADTGSVLGAAIAADLTVTFIGNKQGLYLDEAWDHVGEVQFADLGTPDAIAEALPAGAELLAIADLQRWLPRRRRSAHKGSNGHVLLIGGNSGMSGAILLAARGALRAGAGLVTVITRSEHLATLTAAQPEVMFRSAGDAAQLAPLLLRADVVAIGPGLGQGEWSRVMWRAVRERPALVVDADALNLLAAEPMRNEDWVLTPHPGEAARLLGVDSRAVQAQRLHRAMALQQRYGGVAVLKGAGSLVASVDERRLCPYGNPGMGVGGMGDVLCGIIAGLRAQGLPAATAAAAGVLAHACAGDRAAHGGERGLIPADLLAELRAVVNP